MRSLILCVLTTLFLLARPASAQNIDMSTLPARESVQLTIYNAEDLTLVREQRTVTVRNGITQLQFSWANTLIDPSSVSLRLNDQRLELVDTTFPHDRPQVLYWSVRSSFNGAATVDITYFTSGISWAADYVGVVNASESDMAVDGFVTITNGSGEDYENASVRMVVGTINLVEKIRELATRGAIDPAKLPELERLSSLKEMPRPMRDELADGIREAASASFDIAGAPKEIVKEGLSEYFIFTVPGEETVRNGWSKRMRLFAPDEGKKVPFRIEYRY
ncbi:MAG: hypothetical protein JNL80_15685, partial [Phycisphaerae bacterium]|nr:hypothetical protein [Phycisphaerae bacterium]